MNEFPVLQYTASKCAALCAAIALVVGGIAGCASMPKVDNSVVADFKLERYLGE